MSNSLKVKIGLEVLDGESPVEVISPVDGSILGDYSQLTSDELERVLDAAFKGFDEIRRTEPKERADIIGDVGRALNDALDELAELMMMETGKPISLAAAEARTAFSIRNPDSVFNTGVSEATRNRNIVEPLFVPVGSLQRMNMVRRFPRGTVLSSIPHTNALTLAAHQFVTAIASGNTMILKPPTDAALTVMRFSEIAQDVLGERAWFITAPMSYELFKNALLDQRIQMLSFFGSLPIANKLRTLATCRHMAFYTGGGATAIVMNDCDVKYAAECICRGAFANAGQSGFAIEAVLVHETIYPQFRDRLANAVETLAQPGDPLDKDTLVAAMKKIEDAEKLEEWISSAKSAGARFVTGGKRNDRVFEPTIIEDVELEFLIANPRPMGPVCVMLPIGDIEDAVEIVDSLKKDFIVSLFSREQDDALLLLQNLNVGTIITNEYPLEMESGVLYRSANTCGGGLAGVRFAIEEMTEPRNLLFNNFWGG